MSMYDFLCSGDALGTPPSHSFDCISFQSYTGDYNIFKSYIPPAGNYSLDTYDGPFCSTSEMLSNKTVQKIGTIPVYDSNGKFFTGTNGTINYSCNKNSVDACTGTMKEDETVEKDSRIDSKSCVLYESRQIVIGTTEKSKYYNRLFDKNNTDNQAYIETYTHYGPYLPAPINGYVKTDYKENFVPNKESLFPPNDELSQTPDILISALEINGFLYNVPNKKSYSYIARICGIYYYLSKDFKKESNLKAYNEEYGLIDLTEANRKDIFKDKGGGVKEYIGIDPSIEDGRNYLLQGSYKDSFLAEIYYFVDGTIGRDVISVICCGFRRFFDYDSPTEYKTIQFVSASTKANPVTNTKPNINWTDSFVCDKGEFISQLGFSYINLPSITQVIGAALIQKVLKVIFSANPAAAGAGAGLSAAALYLVFLLLGPLNFLIPFIVVLSGIVIGLGDACPFITLKVRPSYTGLKSITQVRKLKYNRDRVYNWVENVKNDPYYCCNLVSDSQYDPESIEAFYCRNNLEYQVDGNFPDTSIPNQKCRNDILTPYCNANFNKKDNKYFHYDPYKEEPAKDEKGKYAFPIETDLCKQYCSLDDTNCDIGIKEYCNSSQFISTGSSPSVMKLLKDDICGCSFKDDSPSVRYQDSLPKSLRLFLGEKLKFQYLNEITDPLRQECTLPSCNQTTYKLYAQKQSLKNKKCNDTELCIGNGFIIPFVTNEDMEVDCKRFMGGEFNCIKDQNGNTKPNITIIPDFINTEKRCAERLDGSPEDFLFEPEFCELSDTKFLPKYKTPIERQNARKQCVEMYMIKTVPEDGPNVGKTVYTPVNEEDFILTDNGDYILKNKVANFEAEEKVDIEYGKFLRLEKKILKRQYPKNDESLCPPFLKNENKENILDKDGNPIREETGKWIKCPVAIPIEEEETIPESNNMSIVLGIIAIVILGIVIMKMLKKK